MSKTVIYDVAADSGGALSILNNYYDRAKNDAENQYVFIVGTPKLPKLGNISIIRKPWVKRSWLHRIFFDIFVANRIIKGLGADQILSLQNILVPFCKVPTTVYIHQSLQFAERRYKIYDNLLFWTYQNIISRFICYTAHHADGLIVQTNWMKEALINKWHISANKIIVERPDLPSDRVNGHLDKKIARRQFIYPAGPYGYKRHMDILKAIKLLKDLHIHDFEVSFTINGYENRLSRKLSNYIKAYSLPVKMIGSISQSELYDKYDDSVLIFPSELESFGMPLLEARSNNTPVIAANTIFAHEILDGYVLSDFFEIGDYKNIAIVMASRYLGTNLKEDELTDILFIGGMYDKECEAEYLKLSKVGLQAAVNTYQWNIIDGLHSISGTVLSAITAPYLSGYPGYRKLWVQAVKREGFSSIGYINLPIFKSLSRLIKLTVLSRKWARNSDLNDRSIICYYLSIPQMIAALLSGDRHAKKILIIPDLPEYLNLSNNLSIFSKAYQALKRSVIVCLLRKFDGYVLMTEHMATRLQLPKDSWMLMEGIVAEDDIESEVSALHRSYDNKKIIYAGGLHQKYGVQLLLEAMNLIKTSGVTLAIYGSGEMAEYLSGLHPDNYKLEFMGFRQRSEVVKEQKAARILVNPRLNDFEYVKYSFPSKNLEYLAMGAPVVCTKLDCIPSEYDKYFYYSKGDASSLAAKIDSIMALPTSAIREHVIGQLNFVKSEKCSVAQAARLKGFIMRLSRRQHE